MFLDTSGLLSLLSPREPHHASAVELYGQSRTRITHNLVLAELVALGQSRGIHRPWVPQTVEDLIATPAIELNWVDSALNGRALVLLRSRLDRAYSLADAVSFILMRDCGVVDALTTDHHFEQEGFRRLLAPIA